MRTSSRWLEVAALIASISLCSTATAGTSKPVPVMAAFTVKLDQAVTVKTAANGAPFTATLKQPVEVDGQIVIPAGASAGGVMTKGAPGCAEMELNSIFVNGKSYRITTEPVTVGQKASFPPGATVTFHLMLSFNVAR